MGIHQARDLKLEGVSLQELSEREESLAIWSSWRSHHKALFATRVVQLLLALSIAQELVEERRHRFEGFEREAMFAWRLMDPQGVLSPGPMIGGFHALAEKRIAPLLGP